MEIILRWWMLLPTVFFIIPIIYAVINRTSTYDDCFSNFRIDTLVLFVGGWSLAVGILIGHYFI